MVEDDLVVRCKEPILHFNRRRTFPFPDFLPSLLLLLLPWIMSSEQEEEEDVGADAELR